MEQLVQSKRLGSVERVPVEEESCGGRLAQVLPDDRIDDLVRERPAGVHDLGGSDPQVGALAEVSAYEIAELDARHCQGPS